MRASHPTWRVNTTAMLLVVALIQCSYSYTSGVTDYELPEKRDLEALKRTIDRLDDSVTRDLPYLPSLEPYHEVVDSDLSSELILPETEYNSSPTAKVASRDTGLDSAKFPNPFAKSPYQPSRSKGQYLLSLLENPTCAPPTPFTQFSDLQSWGWTYQMGGNVLSILGSLASIMTRYGWSMTSPPNQDWRRMHTQRTVHGNGSEDVVYPPTGGKYQNVYNPASGLIVAYSNFGPANQVQQRSQPYGAVFSSGAPLPQLQQWSDVAFLTWSHITTPAERKKLKYIIRLNVVNAATNNIISAALKKDDVSSGVSPKWPGHMFKIDENPGPLSRSGPFQAMLGTPNCVGIVFLLVQHVEQLGSKTVKSITVWDRSEFAAGGAMGEGFLASLMVIVGDV